MRPTLPLWLLPERGEFMFDRAFAPFFLSVLAIWLPGCSDDGYVNVPNSGYQGSGSELACSAGRSRGPSEPCCLDFGVDACGANLFCAAFDGRSQATCYVVGTRTAGEECKESKQCLSGSCVKNKCAALLSETCDPAIGCAQKGATGTANPIACKAERQSAPTCTRLSLTRCESGPCASAQGDICAVRSAGLSLKCPRGTECVSQGGDVSTCEFAKSEGGTGKAPLYSACNVDADCGDGTYDGVCLPQKQCGYKRCGSDADCTNGKRCLACRIRSSGAISACVSDKHVGYEGATCTR
jgi:hypothetical protein